MSSYWIFMLACAVLMSCKTLFASNIAAFGLSFEDWRLGLLNFEGAATWLIGFTILIGVVELLIRSKTRNANLDD